MYERNIHGRSMNILDEYQIKDRSDSQRKNAYFPRNRTPTPTKSSEKDKGSGRMFKADPHNIHHQDYTYKYYSDEKLTPEKKMVTFNLEERSKDYTNANDYMTKKYNDRSNTPVRNQKLTNY